MNLPRNLVSDRWFFNAFRQSVVDGLAEQNAFRSSRPLSFDAERKAWVNESIDGLASPPALMQGRRLIVEATDRGFLLLPPGRRERFAVDIVLSEASTGNDVPPLAAEIAPGSMTRRLANRRGRVVASVDHDLPLLAVRIESDGLSHLRAGLRWMPAGPIAEVGDLLWLRPAQVPLVRTDLCHNNSRVPDPATPDTAAPIGLAIGLLVQQESAVRRLACATPESRPLAAPVLLVDQPTAGCEDLLLLDLLPGVPVTVVLLVTESAESVNSILDQSIERPSQEWTQLTERVRIDAPNAELSRQAPFSVHNSLACRAKTTGDRDIFVHGRRDRGYADVAHLHQSYMLHLPALAAGETTSVREEILAFLALQDDDGALRAAPRPGGGSHPYVGTYTNAHLPMALHRYLSWSQDRSILDERVGGLSVLERTRRACQWLLDQRYEGVVKPCGWLDAWPPDVRGQAQTSIAAIMGLLAFDEIERLEGNDSGFAKAAQAIADAVHHVFWSDTSGLFAEQLLASGAVEGGTEADFFAHTQIWAALAGIAPDRRGLDHVRAHCFDRGVFAVPASAMESGYLRESTDGTDDLSVDSTATWLLARWPELTHLYALAEIEANRPDRALAAVLDQLPEALHHAAPECLPYLYPEKYLAPGTVPWLCTWAGDPSLIEILLTGFAGVRPSLEGLLIRPRLPTAWLGKQLTFSFTWAGGDWRLDLSPEIEPGTLTVDGERMAADAGIGASPGKHLLLGSSLTLGR